MQTTTTGRLGHKYSTPLSLIFSVAMLVS